MRRLGASHNLCSPLSLFHIWVQSSYAMWLTGVTVQFDRLKPASAKITVGIGSIKPFENRFDEESSRLRISLPPCEIENGAVIAIRVSGPKARKIGPRSSIAQVSISAEDALAHFDVNTQKSTLRDDKGACSFILDTIADKDSLSQLLRISNCVAKEMTSILDVLGRWKGRVESVLDVAKVAGEFHPAAKAAVGFLDVVHKQLKAQADCDDGVRELCSDLLTLFRTVEKVKGIKDLDDFLLAVRDTDKTLKDSFRFIITYANRKGRNRVFRGGSIDRANLNDIRKQISGIHSRLSSTVLLYVADTVQSIATRNFKESPSSHFFKPQLPSKPIRLLGRDTELETMVSTLTGPNTAAIAILGDGGMGKTTLASSVLHDYRVKHHYASRLFVSCESIGGRPALLAELADVLRIPADQRKENLLDEVDRILQRALTLLCLDNFETPWHKAASRQDIENILCHLADLSNVSLVVTLRGTQYPAASGINWSRTLHPLGPLSIDTAHDLYQQTAGLDHDEYTTKLVVAADGIPLALTLMAQLSQSESSSTLWARWQHEGTAFIESDGGMHRSASLDVSISLSVHSPPMNHVPYAHDVLSLLALLPDGLPESGAMFDLLQEELPSHIVLRRGLVTLQRVALVHSPGTDACRRYRLLSPIQQWVRQQLPVQPDIRDATYKAYIKLMLRGYDYTRVDNRKAVCAELHNCGTILLEAFRCDTEPVDLVLALAEYSEWLIYESNYSDDVIQIAISRTTDPIVKGRCHRILGRFQEYKNELDGAENSFRAALTLDEEGQDVKGQAWDLQMIGELQMRRDELDQAEKSFRSAFTLHERAQDILWQGYDLQSLGKLHMRRDELDEAGKSFRSALALHELVQSVLGQAYDLQNIGQLQMRHDELDEAEKSFRSALKFHERAQDILGQANDHRDIGELQLRRDELDQAEQSFRSALALHELVQSALGQANDLQSLGDLHVRRDELDAAEHSFRSALAFHERAQDVLGHANDLEDIGKLQLRRNQLNEAEKSFRSALALHERALDVWGQANDLTGLGKLRIRQNNAEDAEQFFTEALPHYRQVQDSEGQGDTLQGLAETYLLRGKLESASALLHAAQEFHTTAHATIERGRDCRLLGQVYLQQKDVHKAEAAIKEAISVHGRAQSCRDLGDDFRALAQLHICRGKLDEADVSFAKAIELHKSAQDVRGRQEDFEGLEELRALSSM